MPSKRLMLAATIVAALTALPTAAAAQQIGVKAGVNVATLTNAEFPDHSQRIGLVGGLFVTVPATERFSFQIEGLYSEKGIKIEVEESGFELDGNLRLRYLEVPVLGRADFGTAGSSPRFYAVAGAAPAFNVGAQFKAEALGEEETEDISDDIESFDLGLVGGLGVEYGNLNVEARYTHGLMSVAKDDDSVKSRVFSVTAGYRFR